MHSTKSRSSVAETTPRKNSPANSKDRKLSKVSAKLDSVPSSPLQKSRHSVDGSPIGLKSSDQISPRITSHSIENLLVHSSRFVKSKPAVNRRSPRITTPPIGRQESLSSEQSPRLVDSKLSINERSPKVPKPSIKQQQPLKASELQAKLSSFQEDLNKVREQLAFVEKEKVQVIAEVEEANRFVAETNGRLSEALAALNRAEESSSNDKLQATELEKVLAEVAEKREDERQNELRSLNDLHMVTVSTLMSTMEELKGVKHELLAISDVKNTAVSHANDVMKIADSNAEKVKSLSDELTKLNSLYDLKSESQANEIAELVKEFNCEIYSLKQDLERAKSAEEKLPEVAALIDVLKIELINAKRAAEDAGNLVDEWKRKARLLEVHAKDATISLKMASRDVHSMTKQVEESSTLLHDAESEITSLRCSIDALEISLRRHKGEISESDRRMKLSKQEVLEVARAVRDLKSEIQSIKEQKLQAMDSEMVAALKVQSLLEEKNKLINELEASKYVVEKSKKARESLESALNEVSREVEDTKEKLLTTRAEVGYAESQIEDLKLVLKATEENYEALLSKARDDISHLEKLAERSKIEAGNLKAAFEEKEVQFTVSVKKSDEKIVAVKEDMMRLVEESKAEWEEKESGFVDVLKRSDEERAAIKGEIDKLFDMIKEAEKEASGPKEGEELQNLLKSMEYRTSSAKELADAADTENIHLEEKFLERVNDLQLLTQDNDRLRASEAASLKRAEELSLLLESFTQKTEENVTLSSSDNEYDLLPRNIEELGEDEDGGNSKKPNMNSLDHQVPNGSGYNGKSSVGSNSWVKCDATEDMSHMMDPQLVSFEDKSNLNKGSNGFKQVHALSSGTLEDGDKQSSKQLQQQQKNPLLYKFGGLLKRKSNPKC